MIYYLCKALVDTRTVSFRGDLYAGIYSVSTSS